MKILHVLDHSLPVQSGYAFRSAAILREQRARGWDAIAVTGPKQGRDKEQPAMVDGFTYLRTPERSSWVERLPAGGQLRTVELLREQLKVIVRRERPDIIQAHSPCLNALAALALGVPLVYELRSSWEDAAVSTGTTTEGSLRYRASRWLETRVLRRADAVTTICEGLRVEAIRRGVPAERVTVIANAVDENAFTPAPVDAAAARARLGLDGNYVLGFIGSFFAWEGLNVLLEALPAVLAARPDARVLLVGAGVHDAALRATAARLGLGANVIFAGQVPHARVPEMYAAIDLLVYPRLPMRLTDMVTPLKPLEAMALGKALVASDVGGHRELIADGETGVLFRAGDPAALARAVLGVMESPTLAAKLRARGPEFVRAERTWSKVVAGYEPVYQRLTAARGR